MFAMALAAACREEGVENRSNLSSTAADPSGSIDGAGLSRPCLSSIDCRIKEWAERSWSKSEHGEVTPRAYAMVGIAMSRAMLGIWRIVVWTVSCCKTVS